MSFEEWMNGWEQSSKGTPYRRGVPDSVYETMGIKENARGHHFWINSKGSHFLMKSFIWSEGYPTEEEAMRKLYRGEKAMIMETEQSRFPRRERKENA